MIKMNILYELKKSVPVREFTFHSENYSKKLLDELNEASRETGLAWGLIHSDKYSFTIKFGKKGEIGDIMNSKEKMTGKDIQIEIKDVSEEYGQYWGELTASYKDKALSDLLNEEEMKKLGNDLERAFEACPYQKWELKGGSFILELPSACWSFSEEYDKEDAEDIINEYRNICASAIEEVISS